MQHQWFSHLPKNEQDEFKKLVLGSQKVLDRAAEIVYTRSIVETRPPIEDYDSPSWAYKQADRNGYLRAYTEIFNLLKLKET